MGAQGAARRRLAIAGLGVAGLAFYVWAALAAPIVLWSDSKVDLRWAHQGIGIWNALSPSDTHELHPVKPGYLLFLRLAELGDPGESATRAIVLLQSLILWAGIASAATIVGRQRGVRLGVIAYVVLILFLPIRDSASAVMSEALAAGVLLPLAAFAVLPPRRSWWPPAIALALIVLYGIRPNLGAVAFVLVTAGWLVQRRIRPVVWLAVVFAAGMIVLFALQTWAGVRDLRRSVPIVLHFGSAEYYWSPSLGEWPEGHGPLWSNPRTRRALENWRDLLAKPAPDRDRELLWRGLHGLFGADYYDARWSIPYDRLDRGVRYVAPALILLAICLGVTRSGGSRGRSDAVCTLILLLAVISQDLLFGSSPRLVLPFLPALLLLGVASVRDRSRVDLAAAGALTCLGLLIFSMHPEVMSWDFGAVESAGVTLEQTIPAGALPQNSPAVMHIRIAPTTTESAGLVVSVGGNDLAPTQAVTQQVRPILTVSLPQQVLDENRSHPIILRLVSAGTFGPDSYLVFPVIPPPWRSEARRLGNPTLSPASDVSSGSLDWWAHSGAE